jgi:hypothetical protein
MSPEEVKKEYFDDGESLWIEPGGKYLYDIKKR